MVYANSRGDSPLTRDLAIEKNLRVGDRTWTLRMAPTPDFVERQKSGLPLLVLGAGLLVAALAALSVRYVLISRLKSAHLAKSLALNAGIISSSAHLVIAIDAEYRIMIFNRAAEKALGYAAQEVVGRRAIPIFMDPAELLERARTLSAELGENVPLGPEILTRIPLRDGLETRAWTFVRKDGSRFPTNVIITPLRDEQGVTAGFLGVIEDVSSRHEVDRMKSEFTAVVSHELRTPLTSIRGSLGLILGAMAGSLPQKVRDLLEIAQSNSDRLVLLINDILDIEKFSAGQMRFDIATLSLGDVVRQAVESNEGYARKHHVSIALAAVDPALQRRRRSGPLRSGADQPAVERREVFARLGNRPRRGGANAATPCASACATPDPESRRTSARASSKGFHRPMLRRRARKAAPDSVCTSRAVSSSRCRAGSASNPWPARARRSGWNCRWRRATSNDCLSPGISNSGLPALPHPCLGDYSAAVQNEASTPPLSPWPRWRGYVLAVVLSAAVLLLRVLVEPWMGHQPFLLLFLIPVILTAYMGGLRPGLFATALAGASAKFWAFPPFYTHLVRDSGRLRALAVPCCWWAC